MKYNIGKILLFSLIIIYSIHSASANVELKTKDLPEVARRAMNIETYDDFSIKYGIDNKIRLMLGRDYKSFRNNFEFAGANVHLKKDGGTFFSGWRNGLSQQHASALVTYPDGRLYIAFYDIEKNEINYFGPRGEAIHPAIDAWRTKFAPKYHIHEIDDFKEKKRKLKSDTSDISPSDIEHFRKLAYSIWEPIALRNIVFNNSVSQVIATAEQEIYSCSKAMGYVPSIDFVPPYVVEDFYAFVKTYAEQIISNNSDLKKGYRYKICIDAAAALFKDPLVLASIIE